MTHFISHPTAMLLYELEKLIKSLSGGEKKRFRLYASQLGGRKDYAALFQLILETSSEHTTSWQTQFREAFPSKSLENTASYLFKVVSDLLVQIRIEQDDWYQQYHCLMKARLCFERSLSARAFKELQRASNLADETENHLASYQAARMELTALADTGFPGLDEQQLVDIQMKAKKTLQSLRQIQEHHSLYELLSHRLSRRNVNSHQIDDLILSELSLSTRGSQHQFEPQRLHLLFQTFFFIHTNEYRSALKVCNELTRLMEANESMWDYPPYDYLSALDGISDSLRSIGYYDEMAPFIEKIFKLAKNSYPEHFTRITALTADTYHLCMLIGQGKLQYAVRFIDSSEVAKDISNITTDLEKKLEFIYFQALLYFSLCRWQIAKQFLNQVLVTNKANTRFPVYRAGRLLYILTLYEMKDHDFLESEIRSYKRAFQRFGKAFAIEKTVFAIISSDPHRRGNEWKNKTLRKITPRLEEIKGSKTEVQLSKFYDYCGWLKTKLGN